MLKSRNEIEIYIHIHMYKDVTMNLYIMYTYVTDYIFIYRRSQKQNSLSKIQDFPCLECGLLTAQVKELDSALYAARQSLGGDRRIYVYMCIYKYMKSLHICIFIEEVGWSIICGEAISG
jgi:hypothetical protein